MGKKKGFTIRNKILISYVAIVLLLVAIGVIGILYVRHVYNNGRQIYENDLKSVEYLKSISQNIKELDKCVFHFMVDVDWDHDDDCTAQIDILIANNEDLIQKYSQLKISAQEQALYEKGKQSVLEYHQKIKEIIDGKSKLQEKELLRLYQDMLLPVKDSTDTLIEEAVSVAVAHADQANKDNHNIYNKIVLIICAVMIVAIVIAIAIATVSVTISKKILLLKLPSEQNLSLYLG